MKQAPSFALQKVLFCLPPGLRRIRLAQFLGEKILRRQRHSLAFDRSALVGDIRDGAVANSLCRKTFADYGYFTIAKNILVSAGSTGAHVDVGANFGFHTFGLFPEAAGGGREFILIEANPVCLECLELSALLHPDARLRLVPGAVGRETGRLRLAFEFGHTGGGHLVAGPDAPGLPPSGDHVDVSCRRLDDILDEAAAGPVRLMKMDIEGSEGSALEGARQSLERGRIRFLYFEVNGAALRLQKASAGRLLGHLVTAGYRLFWPHTDWAWMSSVCQAEIDPRQEKCARLPGPDRLAVAEYDLTRHRLPDSCQLDLLAVHGSETLAPA